MVGRKLQGSGSSRGEKNVFLNLCPFLFFKGISLCFLSVKVQIIPFLIVIKADTYNNKMEEERLKR